MTTAVDKLRAFTVEPPATVSFMVRAMIHDGALLVPASKTLLFRTQPGSLILCPDCCGANLDPIFDNNELTMSGYTCRNCGRLFANSQALYLVFGHLAPF